MTYILYSCLIIIGGCYQRVFIKKKQGASLGLVLKGEFNNHSIGIFVYTIYYVIYSIYYILYRYI